MQIELSTVLPQLLLRSNQIMWFLGAGASVTAGVPTAGQMIWEFKKRKYCADKSIPIKSCENLNDELVRRRIQEYLNTLPECPDENSPYEYSYYFEEIYPSPKDRRDYLEKHILNGNPSRGNRLFAALIKLDHIRLIWTTNFDRIIEDSCFDIYQSSMELNVFNLTDHNSDLLNIINENRWPILVKLHGDFQSSRLKNTHQELKSQDENFRKALIETSSRFGIAIAGYSGRDNSIMDTFEKSLNKENPYPRGIFWFKRPNEEIHERVKRFIASAKNKGLDANFVEVETFDELTDNILKQKEHIPLEVRSYLDKFPNYVSKSPKNKSNGTWPIVRFNALQVTDWPKTARLIKCSIGNQNDVFEAIVNSQSDIIAYRRRVGVLAFGSDDEIKRVFTPFGIKEFDLISITEKRLNFDSQDLAILYESLAKSFQRELPVKLKRKGSTYFLLVDKSEINNPIYVKLQAELKELYGQINKTNINWYEAVKLKLEMRYDKLWLLIEPTVFADYGDVTEEEKIFVGEYIRERLATRYNKVADDLINYWSIILTGGKKSKQLKCFDMNNGINAEFKINAKTAFSWQKG
ncbi:MAG: SIR2 family protein [Candidatus Paceibacterota bacterium]